MTHTDSLPLILMFTFKPDELKMRKDSHDDGHKSRVLWTNVTVKTGLDCWNYREAPVTFVPLPRSSKLNLNLNRIGIIFK